MIKEDEDGFTTVHDVTQGMRMAARTGMDSRGGRDVLTSKCGCCKGELAVAGDKVILYSRSGPEGGGCILVPQVLRGRVRVAERRQEA